MIRLVFSALVLCLACGHKEGDSASLEAEDERAKTVERDSTGNFVAYYPIFERIDLTCGNMPMKTDSSVVFVAEAAFTGACLAAFKHTNIAGDHVSGGVRYRGYKCKRNTGFIKGHGSSYIKIIRESWILLPNTAVWVWHKR